MNDREISQLSKPGPLASEQKLHNAKEDCKQNVKWNRREKCSSELQETSTITW